MGALSTAWFGMWSNAVLLARTFCLSGSDARYAVSMRNAMA